MNNLKNTYETMDKWGEKTLLEMEDILLNGAKYPKRATGDLIQSLDYDIRFNNPGNMEMIVEFAPHGIFVFGGRRKGEKTKRDRRGVKIYDNIPPVDKIIEWAKSKGFKLRKHGGGWALAIKIARDGIKPLNFIKPYEKLTGTEAIIENKNITYQKSGEMNSVFISDIEKSFIKDVDNYLEKIIKEI